MFSEVGILMKVSLEVVLADGAASLNGDCILKVVGLVFYMTRDIPDIAGLQN